MSSSYVKDGKPLFQNRASINVHKSTLQIAKTLAAEWGVSVAEAADMAVTKAYWQEFGRAPKGQEAKP